MPATVTSPAGDVAALAAGTAVGIAGVMEASGEDLESNYTFENSQEVVDSPGATGRSYARGWSEEFEGDPVDPAQLAPPVTSEASALLHRGSPSRTPKIRENFRS